MPPDLASQSMPLARWFRRSFFRAAIIPLLAIELTFLAAYWISTDITYDRNVEAVEAISKDELVRVARSQAATISQTLESVSGLTRVFAAESRRVLAGPVPAVSAGERSRYALSPEGVLYTRPDTQPGSSHPAAFFSGVVPVGSAQMETVWRSTGLDPLMKAITEANPLVTQVYLNTRESYNRIYPGIDVLATFAPGMVIPDFNFYYEADQAHNPTRGAVWTDAYIDPAGSGWMVSSIAPVYEGDVLEGVVGVDLTIKTIVDSILNLTLPWNGYAILVGRDGAILALPSRGETDFGLNELTEHTYAKAIMGDTFKPDAFNILKREDTKVLATAVQTGDEAVKRLDLDRTMLAAAASVPGPGWSLVVLVPEAAILADATSLNDQLRVVGAGMVIVLLVFYVLFFGFLYVRSHRMSRRMAAPLAELEAAIGRIGLRDYQQPAMQTEVTEINALGAGIAQMAARLDETDRIQAEASRTIREGLEREREINERQRQFINVVSHEFRTPLAIIDGTARALERRFKVLSPEDVKERTLRLRSAAQRLAEVVDSGLAYARIENESPDGWQPFTPSDLVAAVVADQRTAFPHRRIETAIDAAPIMWGEAAAVRAAIGALVNNALRYSFEETPVRVEMSCSGNGLEVVVSDRGPGISAADLPHVRDQFYRGRNSHGTHGAGLGLYIVDVCARLHGGSLSIASDETGTRCVLCLPLGAVRKGGLDEDRKRQDIG